MATWLGGFSGVGFSRAEFAKWLATQSKPAWAKFIAEHATGAPYTLASVGGAKRMANLANYYKTKGWKGGPHFFVMGGKVYPGTPIKYQTVHSPSWNDIAIAIETEGDYRVGQMPYSSGDGLKNWEATAWVTAELLKWLGKPINNDTIKFHKEDPKTSHRECPGIMTKDWFIGKAKLASEGGGAPIPQPETPKPATVPNPGRAVLKKGMTGGDVPVLQLALKTLGFYKANVDGDYGPLTAKAVADFQKAHDLVVDSVVGPRTWAALAKASEKPQDGPTATEPKPSPPIEEGPKPVPAPPVAVRTNAEHLHMSPKGLELLKHFEGLRLTPYDDRGSLAIGYGHSNRSQKPPVVTDSLRITADEALKILANDLVDYENRVKTSVKVPLTQGEFDALTSLAYNWGPGNLDRSELMKKLNAGDYKGAGEEIRDILPRADQPHYKGIKRRREEEYKLYIS